MTTLLIPNQQEKVLTILLNKVGLRFYQSLNQKTGILNSIEKLKLTKISLVNLYIREGRLNQLGFCLKREKIMKFLDLKITFYQILKIITGSLRQALIGWTRTIRSRWSRIMMSGVNLLNYVLIKTLILLMAK